MPKRPAIYKLSPANCAILNKIKMDYAGASFAKDTKTMDDMISSASELIATEGGIVDMAVMLKLSASIRKWLDGKAEAIRKDNKLFKPVFKEGTDMFREDRLEDWLRPLLEEEHGQDVRKSKQWLNLLRLKVDYLWKNELSDMEKIEYNKKATEFNTGKAAQEEKAKYGDRLFADSIQRSLDHLSKLFEVQIMCVAVRRGSVNIMADVFEGKGKHKPFLSTIESSKRFQWNASDFLTYARRNLGDNSGPDSQLVGKKILAIAYDSNDYPILPTDSVEGNLTKFRPALAEYLRVLYARAYSDESKSRPIYSHMKKDISAYFNPEFLPDGYQSGLRLQDVHRLPTTMVRRWIHLIQERQEMYRKGELDTVLEWNVVREADEEGDSDHSTSSDGHPIRIATTTDKRSRSAAKQKGRQARARKAILDKELDGPDTPEPSTPELESDANNESDGGRSSDSSSAVARLVQRGFRADQDEYGVDIGSPASACDSWDSQIEFLASLCDLEPYQMLVYWLKEAQSLSEQAWPMEIKVELPSWATWSCEVRWTPSYLHVESLSKSFLMTVLNLWKHNAAVLLVEEGYLESFLLVIGIIWRDAMVAAGVVPSDNIPKYVNMTWIKNQYLVDITNTLTVIAEALHDLPDDEDNAGGRSPSVHSDGGRSDPSSTESEDFLPWGKPMTPPSSVPHSRPTSNDESATNTAGINASEGANKSNTETTSGAEIRNEETANAPRPKGRKGKKVNSSVRDANADEGGHEQETKRRSGRLDSKPRFTWTASGRRLAVDGEGNGVNQGRKGRKGKKSAM